MCRETDDKTKRTQADVGKRLGERIGDIQFWKVGPIFFFLFKLKTRTRVLIIMNSCLTFDALLNVKSRGKKTMAARSCYGACFTSGINS